MARKPSPEQIDNGIEKAIVSLRLPVPEREVIITSRHISDAALQQRVREASPRAVVSFELDELEDLHRDLSSDADETLDSKRRKTIGRVLRKIEKHLPEEVEEFDEEDEFFDEFGPWADEWDDENSVPASPEEFFEKVFCSRLGPVEGLPHCRVKLAQADRQTLCSMETVSLDIHKLLTVDSADELEFEMSPRQFLTIGLAVKEALDECEDDRVAEQYRGIARRISEGVFASLKAAEESVDERRYHESQASPVELAYQLRITLEGSKPPIWRQVLVGDCPLDVLHEIIQIAMGWESSHLHQFEYDGEYFSNLNFELGMDDDHYDETQVHLSQLLADGGKKLRYLYDFGDDWWHTITIEKKYEPQPTDTFPFCVKGEGACPPDDIGGIWGYYDALDALRNPKHERHDELVEWLGPEFDPSAFDIEKTNRALAAGPAGDFDDELGS